MFPSIALAALPLFTRVHPHTAFQNPNRRLIHAYVAENPGAGFREILRATGLASGTARHHLNVLVECGILAERPLASATHFFDTDDPALRAWREAIVMRDRRLARLRAWLAEHPGCCQADVLRHARLAWGWSRSTTQHRLRRLVEGGLVACEPSGRKNLYFPDGDLPAEAEPEAGSHDAGWGDAPWMAVLA